jgi:hypothetical protein
MNTNIGVAVRLKLHFNFHKATESYYFFCRSRKKVTKKLHFNFHKAFPSEHSVFLVRAFVLLLQQSCHGPHLRLDIR